MGIHNPLTMNLARQTRSLVSKIPPESPYAAEILQASFPGALLDTLSRLLIVPALTLPIATAYRPLLLDLCARWLNDGENAENKLAALCLLLEPHQELYPILSAFIRKAFDEKGPFAFVTMAESVDSLEASRLHCILLAYYRILQANRPLPYSLYWPLTPLAKLFHTPHPDMGVCLLAIRCYALQSGMGDAERENLEKQVLGEICGVDCQIGCGQDIDGTTKEFDGWLLPVLEVKRITDARNALVTEPQDYYGMEEGDPSPSLTDFDLCPHIANVHGVLLLRAPGPSETVTPLISTPTAIGALRSIATLLSLRVPTLLTSPPSSGKSLLLSHLATVLYPGTPNQIITIHLADTSLDARSLLGSYISSPTQPGMFEWKDGVVVQAMREGKWLVFDDIDKGSSEVLGVIRPLVKSLGLGKWVGGRAVIDVPNRGRVEADESFALFATRSLMPSRTGKFSTPVFFGAHKFHEVVIPSPTTQELRTILDARFPRLAGNAAQALISLWEDIRALGSAASFRDVGLRELEKFCVRVDNLLPSAHQLMDITDDAISLSLIFPNPTLREDIYLEARDVFFGAGALTASARVHVERMAATVAEHLGLEPERSTWVLRGRTPEFELEKDANGRVTAVRVGRTRLSARYCKIEIAPPVTRPFAMHRPAVLLLSRIATAVSIGEAILLTGETGTGKTSVVTHLASLLRRPLISLNLSHQTESSDLLGGFKPVDARVPGSALQEQFLELFGGTFSRRKNAKFEESVRKAVGEAKWKRAVGLWKESARLARSRIQAKQNEESTIDGERDVDRETPRKRRKVATALDISETNWNEFEQTVDEFDMQHVQGKGKFTFRFVEGPLVKALRCGDWILLDEINLASPETLECISGLLHGPTASVTLTEQGSLEPVPRHPDFRLFACMNPATDVGKKDLIPNIRSRFTEIDVPPPDADRETLLSIVTQYIGSNAVGDKAAIMDVAEFYSAIKKLAEGRQIADGSNHRPHYSMRTLARALTFAADMASTYSLRRAIWEGCLMAFTMVLNAPSAQVVTTLAQKHLLAGVRNPRSLLLKEPSVPHSRSADEFLKLGPFYVERGPLPEDLVEDYIMTPSVEAKLVDLARIIVTRRFPVLIEGPTSSGKTSSVEYLARRTGHRFVRINNHEHTDIQEYLGSYVSDPLTGKLGFKDGLLVRALRSGDWIVLDELNLAPTDVLEALNRLLDDNRELFIPETQEVIRPHPHFMLFATQNPPGLYAGRKVLSRAFRNRFLEVHFEDVPQAELETILCQRCRIAPSYGQRIVSVFRELQKRRQASRVFESKQGFATLRDLFRWAGRDAVGYQELADNGYMLLAERARREDDKVAVREVIESVMKVRIDEKALYDIENPGIDLTTFLGFPFPSSSLVWTTAMRRLFTLVSRALRFNEPILLVGETGSGKTSVCQVYANAVRKQLHSLNCHQNTETADLIGGLRPVRNRGVLEAEVLREAATALQSVGVMNTIVDARHLLPAFDAVLKSELEHHTRLRLEEARRKTLRLTAIFEWHDGPLVEAMRAGEVFLLDEISLADDSVLERLNSVLEPSRTIVLAERGGDDLEYPAIQAADEFKLVATMNPGGDYGKKELSPALRNRFTEIWVPPVDDRNDLELIVESLWKHEVFKPYTGLLLDFVEWLCSRVADRSLLTLRDILAWITFSNAAYRPEDEEKMPLDEIYHHAAHMTFLDGLASLPQLTAYSPEGIQHVKADAHAKLQELVPLSGCDGPFTFVPALDPIKFVQLGSFAVPKGPAEPILHTFNFQVPTTRDNAMRVVRACQVAKPILLEGSPGVGKTSLITALANLCGHRLCRINLSDQTDLIDLFGSDLPVEGGGPGEFAWKDAEFLKALQEGHWVLLDEMNLAPQAVLEGLNAVLDHRGTVFIPELGRSFTRHPSFRIFAAQNPLQQGGGRKGLPRSFVNRFSKVYVEELSPNDLMLVCRHLFPDCDADVLRAMIEYNARLNEEICLKRTFARLGSPWEFNLRDVIRWGLLLRTAGPSRHPVEYLRSIYLHRFRTVPDRNHARLLFDRIFSLTSHNQDLIPHVSISPSFLQVGHFSMPRSNAPSSSRPGCLLHMHHSALESAGLCVTQSWLVIVTGPHSSGKTNMVRLLANVTGHYLHEISVNSATDTMDILGSFEQVDGRGRVTDLIRRVLVFADEVFRDVSDCCIRQADDYDTLRRAVHQSPTSGQSDTLRLALNLLLELDDSIGHKKSESDRLQIEIRELLALPHGLGRFEWVDGPLVRALKFGYWLLLEGANLCSPSVLDRLNSLCESDGVLTLSERGYVDGDVQIIKPHPNFRLFMSVDPQYGELSRAMRNRGLEIALLADCPVEDQRKLQDYYSLPIVIDPSGANWTYIAADHDSVRRGLVSSKMQCLSWGLDWPSCRGGDLDSASSNLIDLAPFVSIALSGPHEELGSLLHLFSRATSVAYIPYFHRFLSIPGTNKNIQMNRIQEVLQTLVGRRLHLILSRIRRDYGLSWEVPSDFVLTQPVDVYMKCLPCPDCEIQEDIPSAHRLIMQVLNLLVSLITNNMEKEASDNYRRLLNHKDITVQEGMEASRRARKAIDMILTTIPTTANTVLDHLGEAVPFENHMELDVAAKLLRYGHLLRKISRNDTFDYSVAQATSKWIAESIQGCSADFLPLNDPVRSLKDAVSLSCGLGITEIWSTLSIQRPLCSFTTELRALESTACNIDSTSDVHGLRMRIFQMMALLTIATSPTDDDRRDFVEMYDRVKKLLHNRLTITSLPDHQRETCLLTAELRLLLELGTLEGVHIERATVELVLKIIDVACATPRASLLRLTSYQHLIWSMEANRALLPIIVQCQMQWLHAIWSLNSTDGAFAGPSMLLSPMQLHQTIQICDRKGSSISSLKEYESNIHRHVQLTLMQCGAEVPRFNQLGGLLLQAMMMLSTCFSSSFRDELGLLITQMGAKCQSGTPSALAELVELMERSSNTTFSQAVRRFLHPAIQSLASHPQSRGRNISNLGRCWISLSRLVIDLFVPDAPIDPAAVQQSALELWRLEESALRAQLQFQTQLELRTAGNAKNVVIQYLGARLDEVRVHLAELASVAPQGRQDIPRLHSFWAEIFQFQTQVISPSKIDSLLGLFDAQDPSATMREQVIQESITGFCQRVESVYPDFDDIQRPFHLALLYLRLGLRLVAYASVGNFHSSLDSLCHISTGLVAFPSVRSTAMLSMQSPTNTVVGVSPFRHVLLSIGAVALERSLGVDVMTNIDTIEATYEQAFRLWSIDRSREDQKDQDLQSLYRRKALDHDAANEDEVEELEFLELFPAFEDVMDEEVRSHPQPGTNSSLVDPTEIQLLVTLHHALFGTPHDAVSDVLRTFQSLRSTALVSLLESQMSSLHDELDSESLAYQFAVLHNRLIELKSIQDPATKKAYDFYADANIVEIKKATVAIELFKSRLEVLICEWPDQMVLQHLKDRCDGVLRLDLHSPVAKVLSALELLLLETQNWEIYANRENTLKGHQQSLTSLIVEWRRLELSCWQMLLRSQAQSFANGVSESWFHLYDILVRGSLAASTDESRERPGALAQYLSQFAPLLDDFIRSSPLGQFEPRMRLLQTFESYVGYLVFTKEGHQHCTLRRVQLILHSTLRYYTMFSPYIVASLSEQRSMLEREIQAFIKLASWKDINVHALRQSAQRTHHSLYKIIRKFRDVMRQPITTHLQPRFAGDPECKYMEISHNADVPTATELPSFPIQNTAAAAAHLADLDRTYRKFDSFITDRIQRSMQLHAAPIVDDLATDVIVTAKSLAGESIPRDLSAAKREKLQKALLVRKRKAWSDLLKELKRSGLSVNMKQDTLRQQSDPLWIKDQPIISTAALQPTSTVKVDLYFDRLQAALPQLRTSLSNHHADVTTRELRRGVMLLESGFSLALEARSRLAGIFDSYSKLKQLLRRLHTISASKVVVFDLPLFDELLRLRNIACKLADALDEVVRALVIFDDLQPSPGLIYTLIEDVRATAVAASAARDHLSELKLDLEVNSSLILVDSEFAMVLNIGKQFTLISDSLAQWSEDVPALRYIFRPVQTWLDAQDVSSISLTRPQPPASSASGADSIVDALLINVQAMLSRCPVPEDGAISTDNDNFIRNGSRFYDELACVLHTDAILGRLRALFPQLAASPQDDLQGQILRFLPFLDRYAKVIRDYLVAHAQWTQALFKLDFVLCSVMHTIATQGFCKPPETDESGSGGETTDTVGGVGLGEGSGVENVSKEIEDESQVEGIQGDDGNANDRRDDAGDDNTIEMSEDIGGSLEDVPDSGSSNDNESDGGSQADPEEQMGDLDASDPTTVDEKLWGDEQGPQGNDETKKTNEDRSEEQTGESDVVAKEGQQSRAPKDKKGKDGDVTETAEDDTVPQEDTEMEDGNEQAEANGAPLDNHVQDANTLDLPDDMDLDLGDDMPEPDLSKECEEDVPDVGDPDTQSALNDVGAEVESPSTPQAVDESPGQVQETGDSGTIQEEEHSEENAVARPDISAGDGGSAPDELQSTDSVKSSSTGQRGSGSGGAENQSTADMDQTQEQAGTSESNQPQGDASLDKSEDMIPQSSSANGRQQGSALSKPNPQLSNNPLRSLGDAMCEIRQRFDEILDARDLPGSPRELGGDSTDVSQVEYLRPDDVEHNIQALGPAGEEQVAKLKELKLVDDEGQLLDSGLPMDIDSPSEAPPLDKPLQSSSLHAEPTALGMADTIEGSLTQGDIGNPATGDPSLPLESSAVKADIEMEDSKEVTVEDVETELRHWQADGQSDAGAEHIWRLYESLTHDLAYALCEQLRLILEPTLATRLKGDYRTGKRLNMKKIISYIASDYTKDKVWLRRTKPSQREYQVLIALDDSRSMAESHSVHLAYETMALVSKALGRLEVGDIAIAKFGESVEVLHDFGEGPFTDQAGSKVMNAFRFNQKATNVLSLVETSLKVLEAVRERRSMSSTSAEDLWQLEIIISDGICQDHDRLRTILRKAEEQRVMIVFIIVDSLHSAAGAGIKTDSTADVQSSILSMNQVAYKNVDGRMELQMERYLDSFPFEYYVVLRSVEALPDVLTGTLKQFFERISEE